MIRNRWTKLKLATISARQKAYQSKRYWSIQAKVNKLGFHRQRLAYVAAGRSKEFAESTFAVRDLFRGVLPSVLLAFASVIGLYLLRLVPYEGALEALRQRSSLFDSTCSHLEQVLARMSPSAYETFLTAVAAVSGVFLALYFTALATVAGRVYAQAAGPVRQLIIRDRVGNAYVRLLSYLTSLAILLLVPSALGYGASVPGLIFVSCLTIPAVFAFAILSQYTFRFFDPSELSPVILRELLDAATASTVTGQAWDQPSFQSHNQRIGAGALQQLRHLTDYCTREEHLIGRPLTNALSLMLKSVHVYLNKRGRIPTQSLWYARVPEYESIFLAPSSAVAMSDSTGTMVHPKFGPDLNWIEREMLTTSLSRVRSQLQRGLTSAVHETINGVDEVLAALARRWEVDSAINLSGNWIRLLSQLFDKPGTTPASDLKPIDRLALTEGVSRIPLGVLLGFFHALEGLPKKLLHTKLQKIKWARGYQIYRMDLPAPLLREAEHLSEKIRFELKAEGRVISPRWYVQEIMYLTASKAIADSIECLVNLANDVYVAHTKQLIEQKLHREAAILIANGKQYLAKLRGTFFARMKTRYEEYIAQPVNKDLPWPAPDWTDMEERLARAESEIQNLHARLILPLYEPQRDRQLPDLFGIAVHESGNAIFQSLVDGNEVRFGELFRHYFAGIVIVSDRLEEELKQFRQEARAIGSTDPILDLVELSGYAKLMSEYHGKPELWKGCEEIWDGFLKEETDRRLNWINAVLRYHSVTFGITERMLLRSRWDMAIIDEIRKLPKRHVARGGIVVDDELDHPSRLVRVFGDGFAGPTYDGKDVFIELYLVDKYGSDDRDFGNKGFLRSSLERLEDENDVDKS